MPLQGTNVDPETTWFQNPVESFQVLHEVVSCVDEEAGDNAVPLFDIVVEDIHKFPRSHREIKLFGVRHLETWTDVGDSDLAKRVFITFQVVEVVDEGVQEVLICRFRLVQDEVGRQEAEICELVSNSAESQSCKLENQPSKATAREQDTHPIPSLLIKRLPPELPFEVVKSFFDEWSEALIPFQGAEI